MTTQLKIEKGMLKMNYKFHFLLVLLTLFAMATYSAAADDAGALYKTKCAGCHGANGEGKPAAKAPALKGTQLDASLIAQNLTKGDTQKKAPHNKGMSGLTDEQASALAEYVKSLK
jgi:cytochrome c553